jgi:chromosome segregation ATPase
MSQNGDAGEGAGLFGLSVDRATKRVAPAVEDDPETVRETLRGISEEGTVTRSAVQDALARVSKVVATPETRIELADDALTEARETAGSVADTDLVDSRLTEFEAELETLQERVDALGSRLSELVERADDAEYLYAVARSIRELRAEATDAQNAADALADEIKTHRRKLDNPDVWASELREDVDTLETSLEELWSAVDRLRAAEAGAADDVEPALAWADTALQFRVRELFVDDIRAELDVLETLADGAETEASTAAIRERLRKVERLRTDVSNGLDTVFDPAWDGHYSETVASFDETLAAFEPPVGWAELQAELQRHRDRLTGQS